MRGPVPRAGRAALAVAALACQLMAPVGRASPAGPVDSPPAGTAAYIVSPKDGRWLFRAAGLRFDAVVIHYGETDGELAYESELYVDDQLYSHNRVFVPKVHADDQCLDPSAVLWRSGCTEVDIGVQIPGQALSEGHHRADLFLRVPGDRSPLIHVSASFDVVSPPKVEVSFPSQDQNFACDGPLTLIFSHSTDYEPTADFLERGAGFHGAALLVNETRGTITDAGFVATPPLSHGTHQLRVALFDHRGVEIMYSTTANIPIHVSPRAAAAVSTDASDEHGAPRHGSEDEAGCQVVWLRPSADQRDVALAALAAAATPWLHRGAAHEAAEARDRPTALGHGRMREVEETLPATTAGRPDGGGEGREDVWGGGFQKLLCPPLVVPTVGAVEEGANGLQVVEIDYRRAQGNLWRLEAVAFRMALPDHVRCDVCSSIRNFGGWQPTQTLIAHALLREECGRGALVLDVGANVGWFTLLARSLGCHVVAFEPQAADHATANLQSALMTSLAINGAEFARGIDMRACALGEAQSVGDIVNQEPGAAWGLSGIKRSQEGLVQIARLKDVVDEAVWLMKLDTEGGEVAVLQGWDPVQTPIEHLLIEVRTYNQRAVRDLMARRGYACRVFAEAYAQNVEGVLQRYRAQGLRGIALAEALSAPCVAEQSAEEHWFALRHGHAAQRAEL